MEGANAFHPFFFGPTQLSMGSVWGSVHFGLNIPTFVILSGAALQAKRRISVSTAAERQPEHPPHTPKPHFGAPSFRLISTANSVKKFCRTPHPACPSIPRPPSANALRGFGFHDVDINPPPNAPPYSAHCGRLSSSVRSYVTKFRTIACRVRGQNP